MIQPHADDLLGVSGTLKSTDMSRSLYGGIRDQAVEFTFENGQVKPSNLTRTSFGRSRFYLAMNPQSIAALQDVGQLLGMQTEPPRAKPQPAQPIRLDGGPVNLLGNLLVGVVSSFALPLPNNISPLAAQIESRENWLVLAPDKEFRNDIFGNLREERFLAEPMLRFHMQDVTQADVYPYIRAYTYLERRKASSDNAEFLNTIAQQFDVAGHSSLEVAEYLCGTHLSCPLNGAYEAQAAQHGPVYWSGTAWPAASLYDEKQAPEAYEFQFVNWIRQLNGEFNLHRTTLDARVELELESAGISLLK